jgi:hypothetical protein
MVEILFSLENHQPGGKIGEFLAAEGVTRCLPFSPEYTTLLFLVSRLVLHWSHYGFASVEASIRDNQCE